MHRPRAELNGLTNLTTELNPDGNYTGAGGYDLALGQPALLLGYRIARIPSPPAASPLPRRPTARRHKAPRLVRRKHASMVR